MMILRRDGPGLPKLQDFINATVDFAAAIHEQNQVSNEILSEPADKDDDLNDRMPLGPTAKSLTIAEESDDGLQQSCSRISPNTSRSTRDALKKIDINHPAHKLSIDATPKNTQETVQVVPLKSGKKVKNLTRNSLEQ